MRIPNRTALACVFGLVLWSLVAGRASAAKGLDIYFVDTEGGAATLIVSPAGESTLIDCGNPGERDAGRILRVAQRAGLKQIDNLIITHWHLDHYGGVDALAKLIPIKRFYDRGIPEASSDDPTNFPKLIAAYKSASQGHSTQVNPGDEVPLAQAGGAPLRLRCLVARGETIPDKPDGPKNGLAKTNVPKPEDTSDNARSLGFLLSYGSFRFLDLGDLTWNIEYKLVAPTDKIGLIDVYQSTHHGLDVSNNPVLVRTVRPCVAVYNNGPHKGGSPMLTATLRDIGSLQAIFQMHRNLDAKPEENAPADLIANSEPEATCKGESIKLSVAPDGNSYTVQVGAKGKPLRFQTRFGAATAK
jgi:beta-lactamase superfamily II metal-dependent hydrolase